MPTQSHATSSAESTPLIPKSTLAIVMEKINIAFVKLISLVAVNQYETIPSLITNIYACRPFEESAFTTEEMTLIIQNSELIKQQLIAQQQLNLAEKKVLNFFFTALKKANDLEWDDGNEGTNIAIEEFKISLMLMKCTPGAETFGEDYQDRVIDNLLKIINDSRHNVKCFEAFVAKKIMEFCQEKYNQLEDKNGMSLKDFLCTDTFREQLKAEKRGNWFIQGSLHITKLQHEFRDTQEEESGAPSSLVSLASAMLCCCWIRAGK